MNRRTLVLAAAFLSLSALGSSPAAQTLGPWRMESSPAPGVPVAPVREVREVLHGTDVVDPYRWLEDGRSPEAQAFYREQGDYAHGSLARIPARAALAERIGELSAAQVSVHDLALAGGSVFYLKLAPGLETPVLCVRDGFAGPERVLADPARFAAGTNSAAIRGYRASPNGRLVVVAIAQEGMDRVTLHVFQARDGKALPASIEGVRLDANLAWHPDSSAFYYVRPAALAPADPARRDEGARVFRHVVGQPVARDEVVFAAGVGGAKGVPDFVDPALVLPEQSQHAYAIARDGVRREISVHLTPVKDLESGRPRWKKVVDFDDEVIAIEAWRDELYLLTHKDAPRNRILLAQAGNGELSRPRTFVAEGEAVILGMALAADALYLRITVGGLERLERQNLGTDASRTPEFVKTAFDVSITQLLTHPRRPGAVLYLQGFLEPPRVVTVEAKSGNLHDTKLQPAPKADFSAMDEVRLYATSHDGTKVPITLLYRKTTMLSVDNPTLLVGYGAYGKSQEPVFDATRLAWLERGGIIAFAHVRGGGEYGEPWHRAGRRQAKENTILDLIACAKFLASYGFTNPRLLAVEGRGAGGIAAAGALVRRPDLFAAVVLRRAATDMLRFEFGANGPARVAEFGSVRTRDGFEALRKVSAYDQVKAGVAYPAVLLEAGIDDPQADAWQAAKMAARLQAASSSGKPVLLRVARRGGDGPGARRPERVEELADIYAFLFWQFDRKGFVPRDERPVATPYVPVRVSEWPAADAAASATSSEAPAR